MVLYINKSFQRCFVHLIHVSISVRVAKMVDSVDVVQVIQDISAKRVSFL